MLFEFDEGIGPLFGKMLVGPEGRTGVVGVWVRRCVRELGSWR